ncbi:MAG: glycosyltransferase family 4 protein [Coleofasciculus sp. G1-WW12-02]|uniref:glycosyltransferase family 4 protein n=1 Tax=Coleofasciculus sp. G1-WW12-02 TaxID=3068483 RepID=UPI0032F48CA0
MHLIVIFHHIGGYHAARLRAVYAACQYRGWSLTAVQVTDKSKNHIWGELSNEITFPLKTLLPVATTPPYIDRTSQSKIAASLLSSYLDYCKPNIVVIPGWGFPFSRAALYWCKRHQVPAILMSESKWDDERRQWWKEQLKSWLYVRKFDAAVVGGQLHRDYLIQLGFPSERIFMGYDVVDNSYFTQAAEVARQNPLATKQRQPEIPDSPYFLAVTRFIKRKNVLLLIKAFADYRQNIGEKIAWELVICGNGEEEYAIRHLIVERKLDETVHLPGFITYKNIGDWYGLANAFVHPALQEQWGLVINEACAAKLPVLCSRTVGACHELIQEGENGLLFNPKSQQDITRALLNLHSLDLDSRLKMGQVSQKIVKNYGVTRFFDSLFQAIDATLKLKDSIF